MRSDAVMDRAVGAFVGLAVGDALGTTLEFSTRDSHPHHTEVSGGGPFALPAGAWTDDTAMAMALAHSLAERDGFDARDVASRFVSWMREGAYSSNGTCFDIGITTAAALRRVEQSGDPFSGDTDPQTAGNGSIMRLAPAVIASLDDRAQALAWAADQSRITHGAAEAVDGCRAMAATLHDAILTGALVMRWPDDIGPAIAALKTSHNGRSRETIRSTGYVLDTLEAALWAVDSTKTFEDALVLAVNLGDDADTVGAVAGQIAGALYGRAAIPSRWTAPLFQLADIEDLASGLARRSTSNAPSSRGNQNTFRAGQNPGGQ